MKPERVADDDKRFLLTYPNLEDSGGRVLFSNEHVVLQRLVVPAGEWEGVHSHPGNQVVVHIKGGEWSGLLGGKPEYTAEIDEDGSVGWVDAIPLSAGHNSGNTGDTHIDLIYVSLKSDEPIASNGERAPQAYPDVEPKLVLENHRVIAQRLQLEPGQWTGPHSRPGHQVYIHIKGGRWAGRRDGEQFAMPSPTVEPGSAGWLDASDAGEFHDIGNTGETTIDMVLITLK